MCIFRAEDEEEEHKRSLQLYVFVAKCIAYHFNAKQPTDMARRQLKVGQKCIKYLNDFWIGGQARIGPDQRPISRLSEGRNANSGKE